MADIFPKMIEGEQHEQLEKTTQIKIARKQSLYLKAILKYGKTIILFTWCSELKDYKMYAEIPVILRKTCSSSTLTFSRSISNSGIEMQPRFFDLSRSDLLLSSDLFC